ncbi:MAG: class I SAM-dependent methyltransferase [Planctomycetota bacterium]
MKPSERHFSSIAERYRDLRTTDAAPVEAIQGGLPADRPLRGVDVGCGTGRYTELLHGRLPVGSITLAADCNMEMLRGLGARLGPGSAIHPIRAGAERLPLASGRLDWVATFNAVHHFDLPSFLEGIAAALKPGGSLWIYTRTPEQNARTVWGSSFPGFAEHESRLLREAELRAAIDATGGLDLESGRTLRHERESTRERLIEQARGAHYSTFRLYSDAELREALHRFESRLPEGSPIRWTDENLLIECRRERRGRGPAQA